MGKHKHKEKIRNTGKTQGKHREFCLGWNVATLIIIWENICQRQKEDFEIFINNNVNLLLVFDQNGISATFKIVSQEKTWQTVCNFLVQNCKD